METSLKKHHQKTWQTNPWKKLIRYCYYYWCCYCYCYTHWTNPHWKNAILEFWEPRRFFFPAVSCIRHPVEKFYNTVGELGTLKEKGFLVLFSYDRTEKISFLVKKHFLLSAGFPPKLVVCICQCFSLLFLAILGGIPSGSKGRWFSGCEGPVSTLSWWT